MASHSIVTEEEWVEARKELLAKEKAFTRLRDELSQQRRDLPWRRVDKEYPFDGAAGEETLSDLFDGRSQLVVYHFMFDPDWDEGCKACSMCADHYDPAILHLNHRDVSMVTVSRAPLEKLKAFQERMGWGFKWVSSFGTDFNQDLHVTFSPKDMATGEVYYNYRVGGFPVPEGPGVSVFAKEDGEIFHTYSSYARGLDLLLGVYNLFDLVPRGRDEDGLPMTMAWVRHRDRYEEGAG